jgi:Fe-S-cluster-containing hydrogenase component 2
VDRIFDSSALGPARDSMLRTVNTKAEKKITQEQTQFGKCDLIEERQLLPNLVDETPDRQVTNQRSLTAISKSHKSKTRYTQHIQSAEKTRD